MECDCLVSGMWLLHIWKVIAYHVLWFFLGLLLCYVFFLYDVLCCNCVFFWFVCVCSAMKCQSKVTRKGDPCYPCRHTHPCRAEGSAMARVRCTWTTKHTNKQTNKHTNRQASKQTNKPQKTQNKRLRPVADCRAASLDIYIYIYMAVSLL